MTRASLRTPAKINLGLRILGRRADGYHELESLFLPLDLADEAAVEPRREPGVALRLEGDCAGVPADAGNLASRAARAFAEAAGLPGGLRVHLRKRIPAAAGLGGGSSDAGAVLRALAALHPERVSPERLRALALELGADVPFFLDPRPSRVGGIGERIEPVEGVPSLALLLVHPGAPLPTAEVYRAWDALAPAARRRADPGGRLPPAGTSLEAWVAGQVANDLEPAAVRLCPAIARLRPRLVERGALAVGLSGSGPTLFGLFSSPAAADRAARAFAGEAPGGGPEPTASGGRLWARAVRTLPSGDPPAAPRLW